MPDEPARPPESSPPGRLAALLAQARAVLLFERVWPRVVLLAVVACAFALLAALGVFAVAPAFARAAGVAAFGLAGAAVVASLAFLRTPGRGRGLARLDRDSALPHQPASAHDDRNVFDSPEAAALWALHRRTLDAQAEAIKVRPPAPGVAEIDRYGLRFAAALALFAAAVAAGPELKGRLLAPFDWRGLPSAEVAKRIDAWIDPPHYTGQPPIMLRRLSTAGERLQASAPEGSTLVLRAPEEFAPAVSGGLEASASPAAAGERRWTLKADGALTLSVGGSTFSKVDVSVIPATPPVIAFDGEPVANASGSLTLAYKIDDRYGAQSAEATVALAEPAKGPALVEPPKLPLALPATETGLGAAKTTADLSEHPWAGARVTITLKAVNLAGATGMSEPKTITLPERLFHDPLARALVEQRRRLILDPQGARVSVERALGALQVAPDLFGEHDGVYLGVDAARARVGEDADEARLKDAADWLWAVALHIENGASSQAQRDLRNAEKDLRDALKRGASDEEIKALTEKMREAAERYMRELAEQAPDMMQDDASIDAQDMESLLDRFEDQARNGARADAEAMLDELQNMFENMRSARQGQGGQSAQTMRKQLNELDALMREQQRLRDDTFRSEQRDRSGEAGEDDSQSLQERQQALQRRLDELKKRLGEMGLDAEQGFDDAGKAMGEAEGDLGQGQQGQGQGDTPGQGGAPRAGKGGKGAAVDAQGRALEALRQGAQGLQGQMQAQAGQGQGQGQGGRFGLNTRGQGRGGRNPLGQNGAQSLRGSTNGALGDTEGAVERARRVMEELQRRLADPNRGAEERDYFERLLRRF